VHFALCEGYHVSLKCVVLLHRAHAVHHAARRQPAQVAQAPAEVG
jgi:hypothetical protein